MFSCVRKVDNAIHRINHYPLDSVVGFVNTYPRWIEWYALLTLIGWIAIYPVGSVIQPLNNRGQAG